MIDILLTGLALRRSPWRVATTILALYSTLAFAQSPKELKTRTGTSVVMVNFLNAGPSRG